MNITMTEEHNQLHNPLKLHGYSIFEHALFRNQIETLANEVEQDSKLNTKKKKSDKAKLLETILDEMDNIAKNPDDPKYRMGNTIGNKYSHWRRAKIKGRYRIFFRFHSIQKIIIFAWVNDEDTKRTYGSKNDAYAIFKKMLDKGNPPDNWNELLAAVSASESNESPEQHQN